MTEAKLAAANIRKGRSDSLEFSEEQEINPKRRIINSLCRIRGFVWTFLYTDFSLKKQGVEKCRLEIPEGFSEIFGQTKNQLCHAIIIGLLLGRKTRNGEFEMNPPLKNKKKCTIN